MVSGRFRRHRTDAAGSRAELLERLGRDAAAVDRLTRVLQQFGQLDPFVLARASA